jgi:nitroreductase
MDVLDAIRERRSIRNYKEDPIPQDVLTKILDAGRLAPSGKNAQPWRFVVVQGDKRAEMVRVMREGIAARKEEGIPLGSSEWTAKVMAQAPVTVFVFNVNADLFSVPDDVGDMFSCLVDTQSIGAAIQNMLLAATEVGVGSLWICDVFYACGELTEWLGENHQMVAAVAFGYPLAAPGARPRKPLDDLVRYL